MKALLQTGVIFLVLFALSLTSIFCGMFGYFITIGSPLVNLLCSGVLAYATAQSV